MSRSTWSTECRGRKVQRETAEKHMLSLGVLNPKKKVVLQKLAVEGH